MANPSCQVTTSPGLGRYVKTVSSQIGWGFQSNCNFNCRFESLHLLPHVKSNYNLIFFISWSTNPHQKPNLSHREPRFIVVSFNLLSVPAPGDWHCASCGFMNFARYAPTAPNKSRRNPLLDLLRHTCCRFRYVYLNILIFLHPQFSVYLLLSWTFYFISILPILHHSRFSPFTLPASANTWVWLHALQCFPLPSINSHKTLSLVLKNVQP